METNRPKSRDIKEMKARKIALKKEMEQIQTEIESSLKEVRHSVADRTRFRYWVDKYPLHLLGTALIAGFLVARRGCPTNKTVAEESVSAESSQSSFSSLLLDELKKMATKHAVRFVLQKVEEAVEERKKKEE